ncbi:Smr/MutS family protein [candidate division WOR-3 bacterium]|nr:Smr/MutS family protein [candidate division WOR-3 bacterium]
MDTESLRILDYFSILEKVSDECSSPHSAKKLKISKPIAERKLVRDLLNLTSEWRSISGNLKLTFDRIADIESIFDTAFEKAQGITPLDLLFIGQMIEMFHETKTQLSRHESDYPVTWSIVSGVECREDLGKKIKKTVERDGSIKDSASSELARIRKAITSQRRHLSQKTKDMCEKYKDSLQENFITQRSERYVIAVKTEKQKYIGGLVHDTSESGSTVFMEPFELVQENNSLQKLQRDEVWEIKRIIRALTEEILEARDVLTEIFDVSCYLDFALAKARFSEKLGGEYPEEGELSLVKAKHPLLCIIKGAEKTVPLDIEFPKNKKAIIISGPNAGGKTIAMKTVGITLLLSYIGVHPPVSGLTTIPYDLHVFCDGGDRQSIEEDISTFTARLKRWNMIWSRSGQKTLVLIDEIGASTDPAKGAALAAAFVESLVKKGCKALATTNIVQLKVVAESLPDIINASMDIDTVSFEPKYKLTMGVPGSSYTFEIADKFGFPRRVTQRAIDMMPQDQISYESTVEELKKTLQNRKYLEEMSEKKMEEIETKLSNLRKLESDLENEKKHFRDNLIKEESAIISQTRKKAEEIIKEIKESKASKKSIENYRKEFVEKTTSERNKRDRELKYGEGEKVFIKKLNCHGEIVLKDKNKYLVKTGKVKIFLSPDDLAPPNDKPETDKKTRVILSRDREFKTSIDLRGLDSDTALEQLEVFIDDSLLNECPFVTVIHGIGTGKLKKKITGYLQKNKICSRPGQPGEGGDGVTVLLLR